MKYPTVETVPKSNRKIDYHNTQMHDRQLSFLDTRTLKIKSGGVKLVLWAQISHLS